jgi:hypothetical protein
VGLVLGLAAADLSQSVGHHFPEFLGTKVRRFGDALSEKLSNAVEQSGTGVVETNPRNLIQVHEVGATNLKPLVKPLNEVSFQRTSPQLLLGGGFDFTPAYWRRLSAERLLHVHQHFPDA